MKPKQGLFQDLLRPMLFRLNKQHQYQKILPSSVPGSGEPQTPAICSIAFICYGNERHTI